MKAVSQFNMLGFEFCRLVDSKYLHVEFWLCVDGRTFRTHDDATESISVLEIRNRDQ